MYQHTQSKSVIIVIINSRPLPYGVLHTRNTHYSICTHIHSHTRKQDSKQKVFNLQPLRTFRNLAQHLQVSVVRIYPTYMQTLPESNSFISELNYSAYYIKLNNLHKTLIKISHYIYSLI